jgi:hypothetical protein
MKHYLYEEEISGEEFIVGANNIEEADEYAEDVCKSIADNWNDGEYKMRYICRLTDEEAEASGLDEY